MWAGAAMTVEILDVGSDAGHVGYGPGALGCPGMGSRGRRGGQNAGASTRRDL